MKTTLLALLDTVLGLERLQDALTKIGLWIGMLLLALPSTPS
jgi:hypothetical protein